MKELIDFVSITINDDDIYVSVNDGVAIAFYSKEGGIRLAMGYNKIQFPRRINIMDKRNDTKSKHT